MTRVCAKFLFILVVLVLSQNVHASPSAVEVLQDVYSNCLQHLSIGCAKSKALSWMDEVKNDPEIKITEELVIVRNGNPAEVEQGRSLDHDIYDKFESFIQSHDLVAKPPALLNENGELGQILPRSFQAEELKVPLAVTGRSSKIVKKVILPFLLGLKFKTAIVVPLVLALIALKTWKALTLGLLSLVLTGALLIFKITKPKTSYEVVHYPQHVDHHIDHPVISDHPVYGRALSGNDLAYNAYRR